MPKQYYKSEGYDSRKSIGYLLRRGRNLMTSQIEAVFREKRGNADITFVHWVILMCLRDDLARTPSEISQYICYDAGALTRVIDQMEKRKLLTRKRNGKDRRVVELKLTKEGRALVESLVTIAVDFNNELLGDFTYEEVDTLIRLLTQVVDKLDHAKNGA